MLKKINDIELYYEEFGEGKPLIMLHGNGENLEIFYKLIDKLKDNYKIYAIDSRNHGKSTKTEDYSYTTMASDIEEFIKGLDGGKANVLGFSDGAIISILIALKSPEIQEKLILLGPNLKAKNLKSELLDVIRNKYVATGDPLLKLMLSEPKIELEEFKGLENEILLVFGENDIFKEEFVEEISNSVKNGKAINLKGHDHMSYIIDNDMLAEDIIEFIG
ncbi:Pimeloyl-ACP methyl ester carboxylesterase [Anaerosphaera aminiphila DSM 21120]|uniref:Pimeloyl-ACP methyl ester carboxylesterase n=1 Tax=Anaerosphaera aminiphila DSM 21120 TaxID=1120995 RepID=A0A1M5PQB3_9FIRM|nr:alpha/beta hydrolase [Anaerosphaera aminiphila]SHH03473.1 Pimeloyl-ACP methyl ester carboxylesterase [Anaerosphaera aminiphila DSM 21120]